MEPPKQMLIRLVSWNTMGIRSTKEKTSKLRPVLDEHSRLKADIVFLQETHIGPQSYDALENVEGWRSFFTIHHPRSKGVAFLIKNESRFRYLCHDEDYSGGYVVLFCRVNCQLYTLVNVYNHKKDRDMLRRLGEYLRAINTKGVLVVGGDFNTVLDPTFDRKSSSDQTYHSSLRSMLEEFTDSLSLKDAFALRHPMAEGFTRSQNESRSRLDMFFVPSNRESCVINCKIGRAKLRKSTSGNKRISDHDPLVLDLKYPSMPKIELPEVYSMLRDFRYSGEPDRRAGKINGAEILSAIRSLPDLQEETPDNLKLCDYKRNDLPMTEILKITFNNFLKSKYIPQCFVRSLLVSDKTHCFIVEYLILARIFAKRLKVFVTASFKKRPKKRGIKFNNCIRATIAKCPLKIKLSFMKECLSSLKPITPAPPKDFSILKKLLSKCTESNDEYRELHQRCPLTTPILTMALKQLEADIKKATKSYVNTTVCHFRQCLLIQTDKQTTHFRQTFKQFTKRSGIPITSEPSFFADNGDQNLPRKLKNREVGEAAMMRRQSTHRDITCGGVKLTRGGVMKRR